MSVSRRGAGPYYVLSRTYTHRSVHGHSVAFVKGEPAWVPPGPIEREVASFGAERVDGEAPELVPQAPDGKPPASAEELEGLLHEAFKELIAKNDPADFTGSGLPTVKAVERLTGEDVSARQIAESWQRLKEANL
jgi:hypothetical protein